MNLSLEGYTFPFNLLTIIGIWKPDTKIWWKIQIYRIYYTSVWMALLTMYSVTQFIDLYLVRNDLQKISFNCCGSLITAMAMINSFQFKRKSRVIQDLRRKFEESEKSSVEEYSQALSEMTFMNQFYTVSKIFVTTCWPMVPLLDPEKRKLPYPQWLPVDLRPLSTYITICIAQFLVGYYVTAYLLGSGLIAFGFMIRIIAEYKILKKDLRYIKSGCSEDGRRNLMGEDEIIKLIKGIIAKHQGILLLIQQFKNSHSTMFFIQLAIYSVLLAIVGLCVLMISTEEFNLFLASQIVYLTTILIYVFMLSSYGTRIVQKSYEIAYSAYDIPWYDINPRLKSYLVVFICQAQSPPQIKAGNIKINLVTYLEILKFTYQVFMMCRPFIMRTEN